MTQTIKISVRDLVEAANREIETIPVEEALSAYGRDDVVFIDIRDIRELHREGRMPNAFHCPRDMLEFWIDGQVRELLDNLTCASSLDGFALRPTAASYS